MVRPLKAWVRSTSRSRVRSTWAALPSWAAGPVTLPAAAPAPAATTTTAPIKARLIAYLPRPVTPVGRRARRPGGTLSRRPGDVPHGDGERRRDLRPQPQQPRDARPECGQAGVEGVARALRGIPVAVARDGVDVARRAADRVHVGH